jgi:ribosomal protein S18 acetylase RimI-like enzyme
MEIRQAGPADFDMVWDLFGDTAAHMRAQGIDQWGDAYPTRDMLRRDIDTGCQYICMDGGAVAAVFTIDQIGNDGYNNGLWQYPDAVYYVIHRFCVNPVLQRQGFGTRVMDLIEALIAGKGGETVRLDAYSKNPAALRLYEGRGYKRAGHVYFEGKVFYLYEKKLT